VTIAVYILLLIFLVDPQLQNSLLINLVYREKHKKLKSCSTHGCSTQGVLVVTNFRMLCFYYFLNMLPGGYYYANLGGCVRDIPNVQINQHGTVKLLGMLFNLHEYTIE